MTRYTVIVPVEFAVNFDIEAENEEQAYALLEEMSFDGRLTEKVRPLLEREATDGFWDDTHYYIQEA